MDNFGFHLKNQNLWCENVDLKIAKEVISGAVLWDGPMFIYSKNKLINNIKTYHDQLIENNITYHLGYALKANSNYHLLKVVNEQNCFAITVSGNEIHMALLAGFKPNHIIFNGNGKQNWEIKLGLQNGCLLNIDSKFDAANIISVCNDLNVKGLVLLRINPVLDAKVHPYNSTALAHSKFGIELQQMEEVLQMIKTNTNISLVGLHCHIGSTIEDVSVYEDVSQLLLQISRKLQNEGFLELRLINIGGGLGIDYTHTNPRFPSPKDLVSKISHLYRNGEFTLLLEPGRSIIANSCVLLADVVGIKANGGKKFIVTNTAMTELIRPSLYAAYHHVSLLDERETDSGEAELFDIVGPVCESGDFLARKRSILRPRTGSSVVIWDTGAYCAAMSSNYNLRGRAPEVLIDGDVWKIIRKPETFQDLLKSYDLVL